MFETKLSAMRSKNYCNLLNNSVFFKKLKSALVTVNSYSILLSKLINNYPESSAEKLFG